MPIKSVPIVPFPKRNVPETFSVALLTSAIPRIYPPALIVVTPDIALRLPVTLPAILTVGLSPKVVNTSPLTTAPD